MLIFGVSRLFLQGIWQNLYGGFCLFVEVEINTEVKRKII